MPNLRSRLKAKPRRRKCSYKITSRLVQLSQPKETKTEWYTAIGPDVKWGTQDMMWPIKKETLNANATQRTGTLALPKKDFLIGDGVNRPAFYHSCGRPSAIWDVSHGAKHAEITGRVYGLAQPKKLHKEYKDNRPQHKFSCGRTSPIWRKHRQTMSGGDIHYTNQLAKPKETHKDFQGEKSIQTEITKAALKATPTERIYELSVPKHRSEGQFRDPGWPVSKCAQTASPTPRCLELAQPKHLVDGHQMSRDEHWGVSWAARHATMTPRLEELSVPVHRAPMDRVQFNPNAFNVNPLALKGVFPSHVLDLATPIQR